MYCFKYGYKAGLKASEEEVQQQTENLRKAVESIDRIYKWFQDTPEEKRYGNPVFLKATIEQITGKKYEEIC